MLFRSFGGMRKTLAEIYCIPKTEAEFDLLGDRSMWCLKDGVVYWSIPFWNQTTDGKNKVSVSRFADLLHDRIVQWRLEEVGFNKMLGIYEHKCGLRISLYGTRIEVYVLCDGSSIDLYPTTFTDLLTLIKFLTPPTA